MAKPKLLPQVGNKKNLPQVCEPDLNACDDWIMVKKQKVTILIPPLPEVANIPSFCAGEVQPQAMQNEATADPSHLVCSHSKEDLAGEKDKAVASTSEHDVPTAKIPPAQPVLTSSKQPWSYVGVKSENFQSFRDGDYKEVERGSPLKVQKHPLLLIDRSSLLKRKLRALNLESKLQKAGGLNNWLISRGLCSFVKIFQGTSLNKFQLAELTMEKLKAMGANPVGPRRKLIHAIDCLCQPYSF